MRGPRIKSNSIRFVAFFHTFRFILFSKEIHANVLSELANRWAEHWELPFHRNVFRWWWREWKEMEKLCKQIYSFVRSPTDKNTDRSIFVPKNLSNVRMANISNSRCAATWRQTVTAQQQWNNLYAIKWPSVLISAMFWFLAKIEFQTIRRFQFSHLPYATVWRLALHMVANATERRKAFSWRKR